MYSIILIILTSLLIFGYVKYLESGIFYPAKNIEFTPASINLAYKDVYLKTQDGVRIHGWFIPHDNAKYTFLFCHGNAGNVGHRLDKIGMLYNVGLNIFIIDYRGFGLSQGRPSEKGLYLDAKAGYEYLLKAQKAAPEQIILYGESLGTAVLVNLASESKVKAIILEGAFPCGKDMGKKIYPFIPKFIFSNSFNSLAKIKKVHVAKLFLHSTEDEIVPFALAKKLFLSAPEPKYLVELRGSHNTAFIDCKEQYQSAIAGFIDKL